MQTTNEVAANATPDAPGKLFALPETGEALLTVQNVAAALDLSVSSVWNLTKKDPDFPQPVRRGERFTRFRLSDVRAYIASLTAGVAKPSPMQRRAGVVS